MLICINFYDQVCNLVKLNKRFIFEMKSFFFQTETDKFEKMKMIHQNQDV